MLLVILWIIGSSSRSYVDGFVDRYDIRLGGVAGAEVENLFKKRIPWEMILKVEISSIWGS